MAAVSLNFIPEEISKLARNDHNDSHLQSLSLVSRHFLSITNRLKRTLTLYGISTGQSHQKLFRRFPNLTHLSVPGSATNHEEIILELAQFHFPLQVLDLSKHEQFPMDSVTHLPITMRSTVQSLILKWYSILTDNDIRIITDLFPNLKELEMSFISPSSVTIAGMELLATKLHGLQRISVTGIDKSLADALIVYLCKNCPDLEKIEGYQSFTRVGVIFALMYCKKLKSIGMQFGDLRSPTIIDIIHTLPSSKTVQEILLSDVLISDELLSIVSMAGLPLKSFSLTTCQGFTYVGLLQFFKAYQALEYLSLDAVWFLSDKELVVLSNYLWSAKTVKLRHSKLSDSTFFVMIKNCPSLEIFEMQYTTIGKGRYDIPNTVKSQIRKLNISSNVSMGNLSLVNIAMSCPNLEVLKMNYCNKVSAAGIGDILSFCPGLSHIQMNSCSGVSSLGDKCHTKLEVLEMSGTDINHEALFSILQQCPELRRLDVSDCRKLTME